MSAFPATVQPSHTCYYVKSNTRTPVADHDSIEWMGNVELATCLLTVLKLKEAMPWAAAKEIVGNVGTLYPLKVSGFPEFDDVLAEGLLSGVRKVAPLLRPTLTRFEPQSATRSSPATSAGKHR